MLELVSQALGRDGLFCDGGRSRLDRVGLGVRGAVRALFVAGTATAGVVIDGDAGANGRLRDSLAVYPLRTLDSDIANVAGACDEDQYMNEISYSGESETGSVLILVDLGANGTSREGIPQMCFACEKRPN